VRGKFLSSAVQKGKPDDKGGHWPDKYIVTLLTGDRTVQIEYRDEASAVKAQAVAEPMTSLVLPVGVRAAKNYTFFYGRTRNGS